MIEPVRGPVWSGRRIRPEGWGGAGRVSGQHRPPLGARAEVGLGVQRRLKFIAADTGAGEEFRRLVITEQRVGKPGSAAGHAPGSRGDEIVGAPRAEARGRSEVTVSAMAGLRRVGWPASGRRRPAGRQQVGRPCGGRCRSARAGQKAAGLPRPGAGRALVFLLGRRGQGGEQPGCLLGAAEHDDRATGFCLCGMADEPPRPGLARGPRRPRSGPAASRPWRSCRGPRTCRPVRRRVG